MEIPSSPRYKFATQMALTTFTYFNVLNFPVDIKTLIKSEGIKLKKYSTVAKKVGITVEEVCKEYQTNLAYIFRDSAGNYAIAYNDTKPEYLIRFSLAHELGHYVLLHLEDFDETVLRYRGSNLTEEKYSVLEREANCFARNLISPAPIADLIPQEVYQEYFGIGFEAEQTRIGRLSSDKYYTKLLSNDIDKKHFSRLRHKLSYAHQCSTCNAIFSKKSVRYCPFCGAAAPIKLSVQEAVHIKTKGDYMKYSSIELDENNFPTKCPRCENEDIDSSDKFCSICAAYLRNICIGSGPFDESPFSPYPTFELYKETQGCGKALPGFARYCPDCGGLSSYFNQELLSFWQSEKEGQELL
ncbi:ImmA/IrrE family metallo-endopeptidase [Streptococcus constellatus]|uniref:ImmA/IrrE family metallo-endopeptidase n=1 Tax=Streptococcus constellatus TaxID=76860 RepID=UPI00069D89BB|nr:ImmA/IrrE family metallo-endopeptidase [Streptococcus constellatus]